MSEKQIKFTEIIQMIADGTVPEGAKFIRGGSTAIVGDCNLSAFDDSLVWENGNPVVIHTYNVNAEWYMELPEKQQLTLEEAANWWIAGKMVEVEYAGTSFKLSGRADLSDIYRDTPLSTLNSLLTCSKFYKVGE